MPRLTGDWEARAAQLSPEEAFLLSRIDGSTSWGQLRQMGGLPPQEVDRCLARWCENGVVQLDEPGGPARADDLDAEIDATLDLPVELQRRILVFEKQLDLPYHELLEVSPDADGRAIKRAYFRLSRDYHPDRYFGREIGGFGARLERIFKRVALAYELLMDPATRAELQNAAPAPPADARGAPRAPLAGRAMDKHQWLAHVRRQFRIPDQVLQERRFRARQLADFARASAHRRQWKVAASQIRLAIAFDPWSEGYKEQFGEIQARLGQLRAEELLAEASGALGSHSAREALGLLEEALSHRPADALVNERAAQAALELEELEAARGYAERACELEPGRADFQLTLSRVLRRAGEFRPSVEALERAARLDPSDAGIKKELTRIRRRPSGSGGGNS